MPLSSFASAFSFQQNTALISTKHNKLSLVSEYDTILLFDSHGNIITSTVKLSHNSGCKQLSQSSNHILLIIPICGVLEYRAGDQIQHSPKTGKQLGVENNKFATRF